MNYHIWNQTGTCFTHEKLHFFKSGYTKTSEILERVVCDMGLKSMKHMKITAAQVRKL